MTQTNTIRTIDEYNEHYFDKGGNVPPCIKNILIPPNEFNQDSFIYKISNKDKKKSSKDLMFFHKFTLSFNAFFLQAAK